jgi:DNA-binding NarL/FixJ family response regulator
VVKRISVLLADDHRIVVEGLRSLLEDVFDLVGTVGDGRALLSAAAALKPDVIVCDIGMPLLNGLDAIRALKKRGSTAKIVVLTMHADVPLATEALQAGASAYVLKQAAGEELVAAIHEAVQGGTYVAPAIARNVLPRLGQPERAGSLASKLTRRQRQVLQLVAEGRTMKEIASALGMSTRTAETHKYHMMQTLGCRTTAELVRFAVSSGVAPVPRLR